MRRIFDKSNMEAGYEYSQLYKNWRDEVWKVKEE